MDLFGILKKECSYLLLISNGNEMLLSLIIPVYKVEQYIAECIESVINQVTSDIEVIIVNDGTPDDSMLVIEKILGQQTSNIRDCFIILHQQNQGQSSARNLALKVAKGEYIAFLDSDDKLEAQYISKIKKILIDNKPDIVNFNAKTFDNNNSLIKFVDFSYVGELNYDQKKIIYKKNMWMPWLHIFKKTLLDGFEFPKIYAYEDLISRPFIYDKASSIVRINDVLILYRVRGESVSNNISNNSLESLDCAIEKLKPYEDEFYGLVINHCYKLKFKYIFALHGSKCAYSWLINQKIITKETDLFTNLPSVYALIYLLYRNIS